MALTTPTNKFLFGTTRQHDMNNHPCILYKQPIPWSDKELAARIDKATYCKNNKIKLFFRADDIGVPSKNFTAMAELFQSYNMPLLLAVVPCWLTAPRFTSLKRSTQNAPELFFWHQHGWAHKNHEAQGKKHEFGHSRPKSSVEHDITKGKERLTTILGEQLSPIFTPPWNRCTSETMDLLVKHGFKVLSRSKNANPLSPKKLPDLQINIDLHTRKETDQLTAFTHLIAEIQQGASDGYCGIMLHHQLMNDVAFRVLEILIQTLAQNDSVECIDFNTLVAT